jgi:hypothetical protein
MRYSDIFIQSNDDSNDYNSSMYMTPTSFHSSVNNGENVHSLDINNKGITLNTNLDINCTAKNISLTADEINNNSKNMNMNASNNLTYSSNNINMNAKGNVTHSGNNINLNASGDLKQTGSKIYLN